MTRLTEISAALCVLFAAFSCVPPAAAQMVTLRSADGSLSLRGDLKDYDGETYILETAVGPIPIAAAGVFCDGDACPAQDQTSASFRILASKGLEQGLILALIEDYSLATDTDIQISADGRDRTEVTLTHFDGELAATILVEPVDTQRAFEGLAISEATVALTNRPINSGEEQIVTTLGHGDPRSDRSQQIAALDGVVFVTAPDNPIPALREAEIAAILAGQISSWSEMGGRDGPINVYVAAAETGTQAVIEDQLLGPLGLTLGANTAILPTDAQVSDRVASDPFGFGVTTYSSLRSTAPLLIEGMCGIRSAPTPFTIKAEEYAYTKRIYLYRSNRNAPESLETFLDYLRSDMAQRVIRDAGYVDQQVSSLPINGQGLRFAAAIRPDSAEVSLSQLQDFVDTVVSADRMSLTLRFEAGAAGFDERARTDLKRLAAMIDERALVDREIMFLGFTDSLGSAADNRQISQARADAALAELSELLGEASTVPISAHGFGELSPLTCDTHAEGQRINRRVEIWTRSTLR
ncbi:MAG: phosphate ABC transporter substrate-binding/OmpA family protein [Pseudomonadota bacterium]